MYGSVGKAGPHVRLRQDPHVRLRQDPHVGAGYSNPHVGAG